MLKRRWLLFGLLAVIGLSLSAAAAQGSTPISYGDTVQGTVGEMLAPPVVFTFQGAAGDIVAIETSSDIDTVLELRDSAGNTIAINDDISSSNLNAHIDATLPSAGQYQIEVSGYTVGSFSLTLTSSSGGGGNLGGTTTQTDPVGGETVTGNINAKSVFVEFPITGVAAGDTITVVVSPTSGDLDPYVGLMLQEEVMVENDDCAEGSVDSCLQFTAAVAGDYTLVVTRYQFEEGTTTGDFGAVIAVTAGGGGTPIEPIEPVVPVNQPSGTATSGEISATTSAIDIPLTVPEGATISATVTATSGDLDTYIGLLYGDQVLAENDDCAEGTLDSCLEYPGAAAGDYTLVVTRYGFEEGLTTGTFDAVVEVSEGGGFINTPTENTTITLNPSASGYPEVAALPEADWTILAYYGGDNNLEAGLMFDLNEFEIAGGSDDTVRVVAFMDRSDAYDVSNDDWTEVRVYEIGPDGSADEAVNYPPTFDTIEVANLGELDSSHGPNMAEFLAWGMQAYPAQHYAVAINDHGGAWMGTVTDETSGGFEIMNMPELAQAFGAALEAAGVPKFDLLLSDACLMSSIEYYTAIQPYFNYAIGSPEITFNPGMDMTLLVNELRENPEIDMATLGTEMSDKFMADMNANLPDVTDVVSMAITDLSKVSPVTEAVEAFAALVNSDPARYSRILGEARSNTYTYSFFIPEDQGGDTSNIDLGDLMKNVINVSKDTELTNAAQDVLNVLDAMRVYGAAGAHTGGFTTYYNIYFPASADELIPFYFEQTSLPQWGQMLQSYFGVFSGASRNLNFAAAEGAAAAEEAAAPDISPSTSVSLPEVTVTNLFPDTVSVNFPATVWIEVVGRDVANGQFTVDQVQPDGTIVRLNTDRIVTEVVEDGVADYVNLWRPGLDDFTFTWEVQLPTVTDGTTTNFEWVTSQEGVSSISGRYRFPGSETWQDVTVIFNDENVAESMVAQSSGSATFAPVVPVAGGEFQSYRSVVTADGRINPTPGNTYIWPEGGLTWESAAAPDGTYDLGFLIQTFGGQTDFANTRVVVENSTADAAFIGYVDKDWGFRALRPADWFTFNYFPDSGWMQSSDVDGTAYMIVYPAYDATDAQSTLDFVVANFAMTQTGTVTPITVAGRDALEFTFDETIGDAPYIGKAIAIYLEDLQLGLVFSAEVAQNADVDAVYGNWLQGLEFFDLEPVLAADTGRWTYARFDNGTLFPIPDDWDFTETDQWDIYQPSTASDFSSTYAAAAYNTFDATDASALLDQLLAENLDADYTLVTRESYRTGDFVWETAIFTYQNGEIMGRMHVTVVDGTAHAFWFEAATPDVEQITGSVFNTMLDGFRFTE